MKTFFNSANQIESDNIFILTSEEMFKVRGGSGGDDPKPPTRDLDFWDLEDDGN